MEKCLELVLHDRDRGFGVMSPFILLSAEADPVPQERRSKVNPGRSRSFSDSKSVLTLLTKIVAVHVGLSAVYSRGTGLQLLSCCLSNNGSWSESSGSENRSGSENKSESGNRSGSGNKSSSLQNRLKNLLQVILGVLGDTSISMSVSDKRFYPRGSSGLVGQFISRLGRWKEVRGSDRESGRETLAAGTPAASD